MGKDYYKILGVERNATEADIKKAFRKLAHEHHPDKSNGNAEKFKEINEAYQVLSHKEKRAQYDQFGSGFDQAGGAAWGQGSPFAGGFSGGNPFGGAQGADFDFDLGDIFSSFFGGQAPNRSRSRRGGDIQIDIELDLKDIVFGTNKKISIRRQTICNACQGSGAKDSSSLKTCPTCQGKGQVITTILGQFRTQTTCPDCAGRGQIVKDPCVECAGSSVFAKTTDLSIEIPGGIEDGQSIRLSGQGNSGPHGQAAGDLYATIHIKADKRFERSGDDLIRKIEIPFTLAALGGEIEVETVDGKVNLKIPNGTPSNKKFILRNKGITKLRGKGRGDQIVIVNVDVPTKLSKKQKQLLEELDKELGNKKSWW